MILIWLQMTLWTASMLTTLSLFGNSLVELKDSLGLGKYRELYKCCVQITILVETVARFAT